MAAAFGARTDPSACPLTSSAAPSPSPPTAAAGAFAGEAPAFDTAPLDVSMAKLSTQDPMASGWQSMGLPPPGFAHVSPGSLYGAFAPSSHGSHGAWSSPVFAGQPFPANTYGAWTHAQQSSPNMGQNAWDPQSTASVMAAMNYQHQQMVSAGLIPAHGFSSHSSAPPPANMLGLTGTSPLLGPASPQLHQSPMLGTPALSVPMSNTSSQASTSTQGHAGLMTPPLGAFSSLSTGRTVYLGNLPNDASVDELLSLIKFGPIENVKILPEKSCAFISFLDAHVAAAFHADALMRKLSLHDLELKVGWGKPSAVSPEVSLAVSQGASRNVYLGNLPPTVTEQDLRDDLQRFGLIDQVKIVRDKNIGFVHFLSIATALHVVETLPTEPEWAGRRVHFGKDRCAYIPKNQHQQAAHNLAAAQMAASFTGGAGVVGANLNAFSQLGGFLPNGYMPDPNAGNRTVYLGSIHPDTTLEEICNAIRGGILEKIRYIPEKHVAFATFVDPNAALTFMALANINGVSVHQRRLKVGWGKHPGPPPPAIAMAVQAGGSRNLYIGNIPDFDEFSAERLREDFSAFGEVEMVNILRDRHCAFINYTSISSAMKALQGIQSNLAYADLRKSYGKDRCGNVPRGGAFGGAAPLNRSRKDGSSPCDMSSPDFARSPDLALQASPSPDSLAPER